MTEECVVTMEVDYVVNDMSALPRDYFKSNVDPEITTQMGSYHKVSLATYLVSKAPFGNTYIKLCSE